MTGEWECIPTQAALVRNQACPSFLCCSVYTVVFLSSFKYVVSKLQCRVISWYGNTENTCCRVGRHGFKWNCSLQSLCGIIKCGEKTDAVTSQSFNLQGQSAAHWNLIALSHQDLLKSFSKLYKKVIMLSKALWELQSLRLLPAQRLKRRHNSMLETWARLWWVMGVLHGG